MNLNTVELRDIQKDALEFINNSKSTIRLLDAPCGTGKSLIAMMLEGTKYIITTRKSLQDQYAKDFGSYISVLKGKNNYPTYENYVMHRDACKLRNITVLNVHAAYNQFTRTKWDPRDWIIIDEAHNLPTLMQEACAIPQYYRVDGDTTYILTEHEYPEDVKEFIARYARLFEDSHIAKRFYELYKSMFESFFTVSVLSKESSDYVPIGDTVSADGKYVVREHDDLYYYIDDTIVPKGDPAARQVFPVYINDDGDYYNDFYRPGDPELEKILKNNIWNYRELIPIDVSGKLNTLLSMGKNVLIMSGTLLDKKKYLAPFKFSDEAIDAIEYMGIPSPFPVANRKIYSLNVGTMSYTNTDNIWDDVVDSMVKILDMYPYERGIIHTVSYSLAWRTFNSLKYLGYYDRIFLKTSSDIEDILKEHKKHRNSVIIACGLEEGIDLKDDLARFQIILKMPYPPLGDNLVKKMMELDDGWYEYTTSKALTQMLGRVVRSETDYGDTYIIDSSFNRLYHTLPDYIKESVINVNGGL